MALSATMKALLKASGYTDAEIAAMEKESTASTSTTSTKPKVTETSYPSIFSPTKAKSFINDQFKKLFNRDATASEIAKYTPLLTNAQKNNAAVQSYTTKGTKAKQSTVSALDEAQWLKDELFKDKTLAEEYNKIRVSAPELTDVAEAKRIYDEAIKNANGDLAKIQEVNKTTTYGRSVTELEKQINQMAKDAGTPPAPNQTTEIAKYLLDNGLSLKDATGKSYVESQLKVGKKGITVGGKTTDMYTGKAGSNAEELNKVALANGLDLNSVFDPAALKEVLNAINSGESIDTYAKLIRDAAKVAWNVPDNVAKLMDQGVSLDSIYSTYKNAYANTLELDPNSVTLTDLAKAGVIGQQGKDSQAPQNLYDFTKQLRKDNRWQYTQQANQEVSDITQKVLQDFGFMG